MPVHDPWKTLHNDPLNPFFKKHKSPHSVEEMGRGMDISCFGDFDEFSLHRKQALQCPSWKPLENGQFLVKFHETSRNTSKVHQPTATKPCKIPGVFKHGLSFTCSTCWSIWLSSAYFGSTNQHVHCILQCIGMVLHHFQLVLTAFLVRILFCFRGFGDARPRIEISSQFSGALSVQVNSKAQGHSIKVHLGQKCPHFVSRLEGNSLDIGLGEFMMLKFGHRWHDFYSLLFCEFNPACGLNSTLRENERTVPNGVCRLPICESTILISSDSPVEMVNISLFTGFPTCWVVQDFFHQQYDSGQFRHLNCKPAALSQVRHWKTHWSGPEVTQAVE